MSVVGSKKEVSRGVTAKIIDHLFFPSKVKADSSTIVETEVEILTQLTTSIEGFIKSGWDEKLTSKCNEIYKTFTVWESIQCQEYLNSNLIVEGIRNLSPGETFALYVRAQNCGLMITIPLIGDHKIENGLVTEVTPEIIPDKNQVAIVSSFPANMKSKEVTSSPGSISALFPAISISVPQWRSCNVLRSKSFARQISALTFNLTPDSLKIISKSGHSVAEIREVPDTIYVTQWLTAVLSDEEIKPSKKSEFSRVVKKIRDAAIYDTNKSVIPFRRSGLWMTAKVVLQTCLIQQFGEESGTFIYKLILLRFLSSFLKNLMVEPWLILEMSGKVARRSRKLQLAQKKYSLDPTLVRAFEDILEDCSKRLRKAHTALKSDWLQFISSEQELRRKEFFWKGEKPIETHSLSRSNFRDYIASKKQIFIDVAYLALPPPIWSPRQKDSEIKFNPTHFSTVTEEGLGHLLYDFERNVRNWDRNRLVEIHDYDYVFNIFNLYLKFAKGFYSGDAVGTSRMILTCLSLIQYWDKVVVSYNPIISHHRPGIDLTFKKELLIPDHCGLEELCVLEEYFEKRIRESHFPSLIEEQEIFTHSFTARYGKSDVRLVVAREKILVDSERAIYEKLKEVHIAREQCEKLNSQIKTLECEYVYENWKRAHSRSCRKCKLSRLYKNMSVRVYERPLPVNEECQFAVLAELGMPGPISTLRDLLFIFGSSVICTILPVEREELHGPWKSYAPLLRYVQPHSEREAVVTLMSTKKLFMDSHYKSLHPTSPDSDFIKNNGYNCRIAGSGKIFVHSSSTKTVKNVCTLRVKKRSPYSNLQYAIDGEVVTPNQILCRQNECHPDLSLLEFVEYGTLRCYPRLQLRSIYRALSQMTLTLKNESVFNLICQCIWQTGPEFNEGGNRNKNPNAKLRQAHQDLTDHIFIKNLICLLENYRGKHEKNWRDHYVYLTIIVITNRIIELNEDETNWGQAYQLLLRCRENVRIWSSEIHRILCSSTNAPRAEVDAMRIKMIEINASCALTYSVGSEIIESILHHPDHITTWLLTLANIYDNIILIGSGHKSHKEIIRILPRTLQNLLRRVEELAHMIEPILHQKLKDGIDIFTPFVQSHYSGASKLTGLESAKWTTHYKESSIYHCELNEKSGMENTILQMDIIGGGFLVDGCPVSYLPSSIENHPLFQRTFPTKNFTVRPYPFQRGRMISLETFLKTETEPKQHSQYSFFLQKDGSLIVTEHRQRESSSNWQLLPHQVLEKNIPHLLVDDFTHWWNKDTMIIEFFKRDKNLPSKLFIKEPTHSLDLKTYIVKEIVSGRILIDMNCPTYQRVVGIMARLEHYKYINLWKCPTKNSGYSYRVELPRMGLQFQINYSRGAISLVSKEYRGMKVSDGSQPELETLVGLRNGLLLVDADIKCKSKLNAIFLVPHGTPVINDVNCVRIKTEMLRTPTFFAYEVDSRLRQLKAGESQPGWVFLAYLHAATTSHLPDPFTGMTGTERAFQILQSGHCWSGQPMDSETRKTLGDIARLSPTRNYYPPKLTEMETVDWPKTTGGDHPDVDLPPNLAHDGFQLIVKKLMEDSLKVEFLFQSSPIDEYEKNFGLHGEMSLTLKSYWRRYGLSTEEGRIRENFDKIQLPRVTENISLSSYDFNSATMIQILEIAQLGHNWACHPPSSSSNSLKKLLMTGPDLQGLRKGIGFTIKEDWMFWSDLDFRDNYISIYNLARSDISRKKDLRSEWIHLLTYLNFRKVNPVDFTQLMILQTIAVNYSVFESIDPPPYEGYFMTDEYAIDLMEITQILKDKVIPWDKWMYLLESRGERRKEEDIPDFILRMKPVYEAEVMDAVMEVVDVIAEKWPITSCDHLFQNKDGEFETLEMWKRDDFEDALTAVNTLLRNWFQNRELNLFLTQVENAVNKLEVWNLSGRGKPFVNTTKVWTKNVLAFDKRALRKASERNAIFTIDFDHVIGGRGERLIDRELLAEAKLLFCPRKPRRSSILPRNSTEVEVPRAPEPFPLQLKTSCPILEKYLLDLQQSWTEYQKGLDKPKQRLPTLSDLAIERRQRALEMWEKIKGIIKPIGPETDPVTQMLVNSELFPRVTPLSLFPIICRRDIMGDDPEKKYLNYIRNLIGAYGILLTYDQQAARCFRYKMKGKESFEVELKSELSNRGHENWNPSERPEWLLLELEMDLMVRPIQAKVAERMENPENCENALLQLNMGEGKTAVIVPLLVLSLADGKRLCRVTVLKSLFQINQKALISRIGGILFNRRVYSFPCRRDYQIGRAELKEIFGLYKECMEKKGVVIGLAEHRLSFKLKAYEACGAENYYDGREFLAVQEWLNQNARDVLDESDEILQVKYQLIYTLGKQIPICGGTSRWSTIQKIFRIIPELIKSSHSQFGSNIEFYINEKTPQAFPNFRLLKPESNDLFCQLIVDKIISGSCGLPIPEIRLENRQVLIDFLMDEKLGRDGINAFYELYPLQVHQEILLIVRGLLACGVLCSALSKRWRVNYGVNPTGYRRMAVPFRAKDLAAERTEFGHPDIAIVLTQLSYYYSGLTEEQIQQCFANLALQPDPALEYQRWVQLVPRNTPGFESISHLSGINLKDFSQRTKILFPVLEKSMAVIDFWLGNVVYPHESKQFGWKIGCSPWDLCPETKYPTTGFSGTNDSKLLLPKTISQKDLEELQGTNGEVLRNLLKEENDRYEALPFGFTGRQILEKLVDQGIKLLLDVGALMLELNNEQVAQTWLDLVADSHESVEAAVYFDEGNKLVVTDRITKTPVPLEISTYRMRLDSCVIYLDDAHTRGTDLKIPSGIKGCVTLGKGVTKDKLVQGCMRMRKLGQGHTVLFWASHEVHNTIVRMGLGTPGGRVGSKEVLQWAIENSRLDIEEGFIHWAGAGVYQAQKLSSHEIFSGSKKTDEDLKLLADGCSEKETIDLKTMYGEVRSLKKFPIIVDHLLKRVRRELEKRITKNTNIKLNVNKIVETFGQVVVQHSKKYVPDVTRLSQCLEEEQERELEYEQEAQHEKELPPRTKSHDHSTSVGVKNFVLFGLLHEIEHWAVQLPLVLRRTQVWNKGAMDTWGQHVYASLDFCRVSKSTTSAGTSSAGAPKENLLRPPNWIVSLTSTTPGKSGRTVVLLLISPYEANYFMPVFQKNSLTTLHMFAGRLYPEQDTLYRNPELCLPSSRMEYEFPTSVHSALLMFSGSTYFSDKFEQDEYCKFAGFCLKVRNSEEERIFQMGGIVNGFVLSNFRPELGYSNCRFDKNPEELIKGIIELRNGSFYNDSHIGTILLRHTKPFQ